MVEGQELFAVGREQVKRDLTGDVQWSTVASGLTATTASGTTTLSTTTGEGFNFSHLVATVGTGTTVGLTLLRNGSTLTSTTATGTGAATSLIWNGAPDLEGGATFTAIGSVATGTVTLTFTASVNDLRTVM